METLQQFIDRNRIGATAKRAASNPNIDQEGDKMDNWRVRLTMGRRRLTVPYSMGVGHGGREPTAADVLSCLAMDAGGLVNDFGDWCAEYGYDTDSRRAWRTYGVIKTQAGKLRRFLGDAEYAKLTDPEQVESD